MVITLHMRMPALLLAQMCDRDACPFSSWTGGEECETLCRMAVSLVPLQTFNSCSVWSGLNKLIWWIDVAPIFRILSSTFCGFSKFKDFGGNPIKF